MKRNKWALPALIPLMLAASLSFTSAAKTKDPPWIAKDWTQWNEDDCDEVLNKSPWGINAGSPGGASFSGPKTSTDLYTIVQIHSALPIKQAILRKLQLLDFYNRMEPDKKQAFDQAHVHDLDPSNQILVNIQNGVMFSGPGAFSSAAWASPATQVALRVPDGALIQPTETTLLVNSGGYGNETQYSFPRTVGGRPLLSPTASSLVIQLGAPLWVYDAKTNKYIRQEGPFRSSGTSITFKISDLMYKGKLEY